MAWQEVNKMNQKHLFISELESGYPNFSELCREFGISRETGYKWKKRYEELGLSGLVDQSSRPKTYREPIDGDIILEIIRVRNEHPSWGGRTIRSYLKRANPHCLLPCSRTIDRLLKRAGLVRSRSNKQRVIYRQEQIIKPSAPNQVWTVDFKGWWKTLDGKRVSGQNLRHCATAPVIG